MADEKPVPGRLWKYRAWNDHDRAKEFAANMIIHGELHFSSKKQLNDPFEYRWRDHYPKDPREIDAFVAELVEKQFKNESHLRKAIHFRALRQDVEERAQRHGGVSPTDTVITAGVFSASGTEKDILMWSHYADHHHGICIGIRPSRVVGKRFLPVEYRDDIPIMNIWEHVKENPEFVIYSLFKSERWAYEAEWRTMDRKVGPLRFAGCVDRVVMGVEATREMQDEVLRAVTESGQQIEVFKAVLSDWTYAIEIKPILMPEK